MDQTSGNGEEKAVGGAQSLPALAELCEEHRARLRTLVEMRIDRRIRARVDASDVVQEAFAEAARRFPDFQRERKMKPYVWLRFLTLQQLVTASRRHLGVQARSAKLERRLEDREAVGVDSSAMAFRLVGGESTPSVKVSRAEQVAQLTAALDQLEPLDREVLALRHFEQLSHAEIGELLGLGLEAVSSRYRRALKKIGLAFRQQSENGP